MRTSRRSIRIILSSVMAAAFLSGCSMEASILELTEKIPQIFSKGSAKEIVPTSQQGTVTADGYTVQSSVDFHNGPPEYTTSDGYRVSTSIQGALFVK